MFIVSPAFTTLLQSRSRDLVTVFEFYAHDYEPFPDLTTLAFDPRFAVKRYAGQNISFVVDGDTVVYERQVIDAPSIEKNIGKKFDTTSVRMSNVDRSTASWILNNQIQGMRMVVRIIPRSAPITGSPGQTGAYLDSIILFVGRCNKPDGFNRSSGTISASQDLGTIQAQIPPRQYQPTCPLPFKGEECLGAETLDQKTATYKADKICNKSFADCTSKDNTEFFQGVRIIQIESSFVHKSNESFFKKILNILPGISRKKTTVASSIHDGTPYGTPIAVILGRWKKELIPLQFQDIGTSINFKMAACRGTIKDFLAIRNESLAFTQPLGITKHLGEYGGVGTQTQDTLFPDQSFHSKLAYITGFCNGSDIATEEPAPKITSMLAGQVVRKAFGVDLSGTGRINNAFGGYSSGQDAWTDNPVDLSRFIITDSAYLNVPEAHIGELATAITSAYTTGAVKDVTNAERCLLPDTETSRAGVDYIRYNSTGLLGSKSFFGVGLDFLFQDQRPGAVHDREAIYEFFDPDSPPASLDLKTVWRKRYTANIEANEPKKAIDFLYDTLLPCFRGFIRFDRHGRLVIDCERPVNHTYLREDLSAGATSIKVLDVTRWKPIDLILNLEPPLRGKILIGAHLLTSEVRSISTAEYSADGNSITLAASVTGGGSVQVDASGATLSGGSTSAPASGYVDILGTPAVDDEITITIDGIDVTILGEQEDISGIAIPHLGLVSRMCSAINAEPLLNKYIEAQYGSSPPNDQTNLDGAYRVLIYSKLGVLNFSIPLEEDHLAEIDDPTVAPSLAASAGALDAGAYLVSYAYRNANGNTNLSPITSITLTASQQIDVTGISLPAGADSIDWFVSVEANSGTMLLVNNNDGSGFSINAPPDSTAEDAPKINTTGEEILRVMMSFADKALVYADTTRSNVLDGSFGWPEGNRQSTVNQVKGKYREAIRDFGEQPLIINDERHQEKTGQVNSAEIDLSCVDNFNQASRLCNGYLAKLRDTDFFFKHASAGESLLLEIGDVICLSDPSGAWRNVPVRIEDLQVSNRYEVSFTSRLYSTSVYDDAVLQTDVPLPSALINFKSPPPAPEFNEADFSPDGLVQTLDGSLGLTTVRGGVIAGDSVYPQVINVRLIKRGGVTVSENIASNLKPDSNGEVTFEFIASTDGLYTVEIEACNQWGCSATVTADIIIGFGSLFGLAKEDGFLLLTEGTDILEIEHG